MCLTTSPDSTCGVGTTYQCAKSGECCSQYGWCGTTSAYCSSGCQSGYGICSSDTSSASAAPTIGQYPPSLQNSPDSTCGTFTNYKCAKSGECCSQYGWCGTTSAYCSSGCQSGYGICGNVSSISTTVQLPSQTVGLTSSSVQPKTSATPFVASNSPDDSCGGANGYTCGSNACCSVSGWCGITSDYCGTGCQPEFGYCGNIAAPTNLPVTDNNRCGYLASSTGQTVRCPDTGNVCCGDIGVCGSTLDYCGIVAKGCQPVFGKCGGPEPTPAPGSYPPPDASLSATWVTQGTIPGKFALTYDDGPSTNVAQLLPILAKYNVKATFFINAYNQADISVDPWKTILINAYKAGHQIASHTYDHLDMTTLSMDDLWAQMYRNDAAIKKVIGVKPVYMRPPYGNYNATTLAALGTWGYKTIWQNIDSADFLHSGAADAIQQDWANYNVSLATATLPSTPFISLQHDFVKETVSNWTEVVIKQFQAWGYTFGTVGDCFGDPAANWYRA